QAEDGIRDGHVTGVQTCALPISGPGRSRRSRGLGRARLPPCREMLKTRNAENKEPALAAEVKLLTRSTMRRSRGLLKRRLGFAALSIALVALMGAGDDGARFRQLGHKMMCVCSCSQILLECNHVGCAYSDRMRGEL